jgi:hypothetical protein
MLKKYIIYIPLILLLLVGGLYVFKNRESIFNSKEDNGVVNESGEKELDFLLSGYPINEVPLFKVSKISSCKLYNNWDPNNRSIFGDAEFSYYNVVLYTDASQSEFLDYYKGIFDEEIVDEFPMSDMVKGYVGKYRVTASHYDSDSTGYIQVYFPKEEVSRENVYFDMYPDLFEEDGLFVEHENSYGLLNQVGGQTEYTRYFTVSDSGDQDNDGKDDVDEFGVLISKYKVLYSGKEGYEFDESTGLMKWNEDEYGVVVSFSRDHGRIYLNMRGSMRR